MKKPRFDYVSEHLPPLGFGLMRLPMLNETAIDLEQVKKMADAYIGSGMNYFDTAYMYHGGESEVAFREAVVKRYPREAYRVADKLPIWECKEPDDMEKLFATQLQRAGVTYFDYYLLHALDGQRDKTVEEMGGYDFLKRLKAEGRAKHIGFSYHGEPADLRKLLSEHPELEFIQIQLNYYDWDAINAKELHVISLEFGVPMIIMEPVRGGMLAKLPAQAAQMLKNARPGASAASWAMRFCGSLDGVMLVLSGMSDMEQMRDNLETMDKFEPISADEQKLLDEVAEILRGIPTIPCTSCKYCADCPQGIPIFDIFPLYNKFVENRNLGEFLQSYKGIDSSKRADACVDCGLCSSVCPQSLKIPTLLGTVAELA